GGTNEILKNRKPVEFGFNPRFYGETGGTKADCLKSAEGRSFNPRFYGETGGTVAFRGTVIIISFRG
ncbi:MAG TPA: hypothetical protein PLK58_15180, partial [Candidatus Rifleibacterium sp.]|nr:hypothetical protein [Candidatus Rifleibacterium sp.]